MKIKISKEKNPIIEYAHGFLSRYLMTHKRQIATVVLIVYSLLVFLAGILVHKTDVIEEKIKPAMKKRRVFLKHLAKGMFLARPERIVIDIAHTDFQKLEYKRQVALERNKLVVDADDFVPATIRYKGKSVRVMLRLKGDHTDHLVGEKWSFRIKVRGNEALFGMKQFSIQHPKTRNYIYEWIYHELLKREGLAFLRYDFIEVTLNGKDLGVYALEEFFEKHLIENSRYREGPIIRFDESVMWDELLQRGEIVNSGTYLSSAIDAFQTRKTLGDPVKRMQFMKAMGLLESFRKGELRASEVFDVKKLAIFLAVSDLMGAQHATLWINMRFYFNPITARLEPIGFDGNSGIPIENICLKADEAYETIGRQKSILQSFYTALSSDAEFFRAYISELERVSTPHYAENLFNEIEDELESNLNILYKEFPHYNFSKDIFYHNQHIINVTLDPVKTLHAYFRAAHDEGIELELGNIQLMDTEVLSLSYRNETVLTPSEKIILPGKIMSKPVEHRSIKFLFPEGFSWQGKDISDLKLNCRIFGTSRDRTENIIPHVHLERSYLDSDLLREKPNAGEFDFIYLDEATKKIIILPGEWRLKKTLIVPKGFTFMCSDNIRIDLTNNASIVSYSPLQFLGTKEGPVVIHSSDSTGHGLIVMADGARSILKNVIFENLAAPKKPGWELTGAVTFYESPVDIYRCSFLANHDSDDALNIVRSEFNICGTLFSRTFADAFDCDFGKGRVSDSSFIQCGNDGIDVSGSVVAIVNVFVDGTSDKGISVGESSNVTIDETEIKNSNIGVAVKDSSIADIFKVNVSDSNVGFAVYRKKPEYGPAEIRAQSSDLKNIKKDYLVEEGSSLKVDKIDIKAKEKGVYNLLYGEE